MQKVEGLLKAAKLFLDTEAFEEGRPLKMLLKNKVLSKKNATRRKLNLDEDVVFLLVSLLLFDSYEKPYYQEGFAS